jgi:hypothetical protein
MRSMSASTSATRYPGIHDRRGNRFPLVPFILAFSHLPGRHGRPAAYPNPSHLVSLGLDGVPGGGVTFMPAKVPIGYPPIVWPSTTGSPLATSRTTREPSGCASVTWA